MEEDRKTRIKELKKLVKKDPGADEFVELANLLGEDAKKRGEAREVCFRGIAANPKSLRGRLTLSRLFYEEAWMEFAARELIELRKYTNTPSLTRLCEVFGDFIREHDPLDSSPSDTDSDSDSDSAGESSMLDVDDELEDDEEESVLAEIDLDADFAEAADQLETIDDDE